jgi:hypothetical protein
MYTPSISSVVLYFAVVRVFACLYDRESDFGVALALGWSKQVDKVKGERPQ